MKPEFLCKDKIPQRQQPRIEIVPSPAMVDDAPLVRLVDFEPGQRVTLHASMALDDEFWNSYATFIVDFQGTVDVARQESIGGTYEGVDPMGLFWSMQRSTISQMTDDANTSNLTPLVMRFEARVDDALRASAILERRFIAPHITQTRVREQGLVGTLFTPTAPHPLPAILVLRGSGGGMPERLAALVAAHGFVTLALAYFACESLPNQLANIPLEYFETALAWLASQRQVRSDRMAVIGKSRGGELALLLGSTFPTISAIVAIMPSSHLWAGFGPDVSRETPAWIYHGQPLPFLRGVADIHDPIRLAAAAIPVENCHGPILLISGQDDQVWPSAMMADLMYQRLVAQKYPYPFEHYSYPDAGHLIDIPHCPTNFTEERHPISGEMERHGGQPLGNELASADAWHRMLQFLQRALER